MIIKINELKSRTNLQSVKALCETTIAAISSAIYNGVTPEAKFEIERVALENLFEGLSKENDESVKEWLSNEKRLYTIKNIGVRNAINSLKESEGNYDQTLSLALESFEDRINSVPEVLLYEEFISALSPFSWIPTVDTELNIISRKVSEYKNDIDISKILETMKLTRSNYLIPLIEDVVNNYLNDKSEQSKSSLKNTLVKFGYDPFIRDIINVVMLDSTNLQLEYANSEVDIEKVYSPLVYLGESEVMFNVRGTFYIKKGNNVSKIKNEDVKKLDEKFKNLCEAVNVPNVEIDKNNIKVYVNKDVAVINEDILLINNQEMTKEQFKDAAQISQWAGNTHFFLLTELLHENFDQIAEVDFVKRVYLKEDESHAADVIKLRDNIFITTYDPLNNKSTFYRNINPIQAEKVMMEHMKFDVSKTFKDILPDKEKILSQIIEAKRAYNDYILKLEEKIDEFKSSNFTIDDVSEKIIVALEEELNEIKSEYKDYLNEVEEYTNVAEQVTVTIDVDGEKYTVPIPQKTSTAKGEETDTETGTVVGAENMDPEPASEITFDDEETELLGDSPSMQGDEVDLGVDNIEASADAAEAGAEPEDTEDQLGDLEGEEGEEDVEGELGAEGDDTEDIDIESPEEETPEEEEDEEKKKKKVEDTGEQKVEDGGKALFDDLEDDKTGLEKEPLAKKDDELSGGEVEVEPEGSEAVPTKRVFLKKKKVQESLKIDLKKKNKLTEAIQIGDTVIYDKSKGYVIGQTNDGDLLIQIQGSTAKANPKEVKNVREKEEVLDVQYKFDNKTLQNLTTKAFFEQYVKCGIYLNNTPIKLNECYVKYNEWEEADDDKPVSVLIEGQINLMPKKQIRIFENINDFANPDNYIEGVIIDEESGEALENVLINALDYTSSVGDTDEVRIVKEVNGEPLISSAPAAILKTLSV